jgi:hypothetical protein
MDELNGILRENYENWRDLLGKLDALSSTVRAIHHGMEQEQVSEHILDTYTTINDAIMGIIQYANRNVISSAYVAQAEKEKQERPTPAS